MKDTALDEETTVSAGRTSMARAYRTPEAIKKHYDVEKELATTLRNASSSERRLLYASLYDDLFRRVLDHPQLHQKQSPQAMDLQVRRVMRLLCRFLRPGMSFLEIGSGDCSLAFSVARIATHVFAIDVSAEMTRCSATPTNVSVILSDGISIPVPSASIDLAFSNQLMEHLHPDDADIQLKNIYEALAIGGKYICMTPNKVTGPHDVSRNFDAAATCLHLKEYSIAECAALFQSVGFRQIAFYGGARGIYMRIPLALAITCERLASVFTLAVRKSRLVRFMLGMTVVGYK
jgi:SAM-dependent methyltransferase